MKCSRHLQPIWPLFVKIIKYWFFGPHCNFKNFKWPVRSFFCIPAFRRQIRNQRLKRHKNGWCSHRITEKIVITTRPTVAIARGTRLNPVQHSLVFREYNMSQGSSTGVNLQAIYDPINTYFSEFYFVIPGSRNQFSPKIAFCGRKLLNPASTKNAQIKFKKLDLWSLSAKTPKMTGERR